MLLLAEQTLHNLENKANKNKMLGVIITLLAEPESAINPKLLFITMIRLNHRLTEHIHAYQHTVYNTKNFIDNLNILMEYWGWEYTHAK